MFTFENVTLRPLTPQDLQKLYTWRSDVEIGYLSGYTKATSFETFRQEKEEKFCNPQEDMVVFGIEHFDELVGYVMLALIDVEQRRAYVSIVIGNKPTWGKGVGRKSLRILLDYGFCIENLEKICAEVYAFNERSHKLMNSVGFQHEGTLRKHEIHNGERVDMYEYGLLKDEFYNHFDTLFRACEQH